LWFSTQHQQRVLSNSFLVRQPMLRPLRITLDRFLNRRRSKDIYETVFSCFSTKQTFGIAPPISYFRIFGSVCYVKDKPRAKSFRGIFVGYEDRQEVGYRIYLPAEQKNFIVNYHVTCSNADDVFSSIQQANLNDRQVHSLMKSLSHEIKEDLPAPSTTPKANQVAQSTGHAYLSELSLSPKEIACSYHIVSNLIVMLNIRGIRSFIDMFCRPLHYVLLAII